MAVNPWGTEPSAAASRMHAGTWGGTVQFDLTPEQRCRYEETYAEVRARLDGPPREDLPSRRERWRVAGEIGLTGLCVPREYGGGGLGALDTAIALEAFGRGCGDMGLVFGVSAHLLACAVPIRDHAGPDVQAEWLPALASGERIAANAMTEDRAGSDVGRLEVTARPKGDDYVLDGEKSFASNAPLSDVVVTYAVTDPKAGHLGISAFAVPTALPGVVVGEPFEKMGLWGCPAGRVRFEGCLVPARYRLGSAGQGSAIFQQSMAWERACLFAGYVGLMDRQLAECVDHATKREQFGQPLSSFQAVSHRIADMVHRLESARLLLYRACWLMDAGRDAGQAVALAKLAVSEAAVANSLDAVRLFGGRGYLRSSSVEADLRDAVPSTIFSGTSEIQRELIARGAGA